MSQVPVLGLLSSSGHNNPLGDLKEAYTIFIELPIFISSTVFSPAYSAFLLSVDLAWIRKSEPEAKLTHMHAALDKYNQGREGRKREMRQGVRKSKHKGFIIELARYSQENTARGLVTREHVQRGWGRGGGKPEHLGAASWEREGLCLA